VIELTVTFCHILHCHISFLCCAVCVCFISSLGDNIIGQLVLSVLSLISLPVMSTDRDTLKANKRNCLDFSHRPRQSFLVKVKNLVRRSCSVAKRESGKDIPLVLFSEDDKVGVEHGNLKV
jgi:hypothetical protein